MSYGAIGFNILAGLLYTPWLIHTVGDDQYALYTLAISVINLFLMDFGIGSAVSKFLANYYARGQLEQANRFMGVVYKIFIGISVAIAVCLFVFYFLIDGVYAGLTQAELKVFKHLFIIVAAYSVLSFPFTTFNGVLMANERFIAVKACGFGQKVFSVALIIVTLLLGGNVYSLVLIHAVSNVVFIAIKYICIRRGTALKVDFSHWNGNTAKELCGFSVWVTVMSLAQRCIFNIMPTVIAAMIGSVEVTLFSLAATLEGYVFSVADAINGMFLPKISRILAGESAQEKLSALMSKVGRFHIITIGLIYLVFLLVGRDFVGLWMGEGYSAIYICALAMMFPSLIDVPQQVAKTALLAKDIVREQAVIYLVMAAINLGLAFTLIPILGVSGAAISICVAYLVRTLAFNVLYKKKLLIPIGKYFKEVYTRWVAVAIVTLISGFLLGKVMGACESWAELIAKILLIVFAYAVIFAVGGLKKEEKQAVFGKLINRRKY